LLVTLASEIFPKTRREDLVQTQWAKGWTYGAIGFQEAAHFLTTHRKDFGATIDQVGLAVFFLQRHRMELAMKELLVADQQLPKGHSLARLWQQCRIVVGAESQSWAELDAGGSELVALIHEHDPDSTRFRYPSDTKGRTARRPAFIALDALDAHVTGFVHLLQGYLERWDELTHEREANMKAPPD
jgi:hypothetical protein